MRGAISPEERATLAERIAARLFRLPAVEAGRTVLLFYSFGSEVPTARIAERLLAEGRRVLLPFLQEATMEAAELRPGEPPVASTYGPKEPIHRVPVDPADVDVVVTPGLAFDRAGYRIGYGGGHYDRYLRRLGPHATRVGIAFHAQLLERVPHGPEDQRLDVLVTDQETVDCRAGEPPFSGTGQ